VQYYELRLVRRLAKQQSSSPLEVVRLGFPVACIALDCPSIVRGCPSITFVISHVRLALLSPLVSIDPTAVEHVRTTFVLDLLPELLGLELDLLDHALSSPCQAVS
jgi:hypothetical protein